MTFPDWESSDVRLVENPRSHTPTTGTRAPASPAAHEPSPSPRERFRPSVRRMTLPVAAEISDGENRVKVEILSRPAGWTVKVAHWTPGYPPTTIFERAYQDGSLAREIFFEKVQGLMERLR